LKTHYKMDCFYGQTFFYRGIHLLPEKWEKVIAMENILNKIFFFFFFFQKFFKIGIFDKNVDFFTAYILLLTKMCMFLRP